MKNTNKNSEIKTPNIKAMLNPRHQRPGELFSAEELQTHASIVAAIEADADTMMEAPLVQRINELSKEKQHAIINNDFVMITTIDRTRNGRLWNGWFGGNDGPQSFMALARSDDDGKTWGKPEYIIQSSLSPHGIPRPIRLGFIWTDPDGRLWIFFAYTMLNYDGRAGVWATVCDNPDADHLEWSKPKRIWHGTALCKPTVLSNGEWLLPITLWQREYMSGAITRPSTYFDTGDLCHTKLYRDLDPLRMSHVFVSTDKGATWNRRGGYNQPQRCHDEHMFVELSDGRIWALNRVNYGYLAEAYSPDGGRHWGGLNRTQIECPSSRFFVRKLNSGNILLVHHKVPESFPGDWTQAQYGLGRVNLTAWLSDDDGKTWKGGLLLDNERDLVASPDGCQADNGKIYISYESTCRAGGGSFLAIFKEEDVLAARSVSKQCRLKIIIKSPKQKAIS